MSDASWVVYELIDPRDGACRYVGQTIDADRRRREHAAARPIYQQNNQLHAWKTELSSLGMAPEFRVIEDCIPAGVINKRERFWCRTRSDQGCNLLNRPIGCVRRGDLLGADRRHEVAASAREIRGLLLTLGEGLRGSLPHGRGPMRHLDKSIHELLNFICTIEG